MQTIPTEDEVAHGYQSRCSLYIRMANSLLTTMDAFELITYNLLEAYIQMMDEHPKQNLPIS